MWGGWKSLVSFLTNLKTFLSLHGELNKEEKKRKEFNFICLVRQTDVHCGVMHLALAQDVVEMALRVRQTVQPIMEKFDSFYFFYNI